MILHVTRLDPGKFTRRPALLSFRSFLRSSRTLGISVAQGTRAGKDFLAGVDSGHCFFPSFSTWQLRGDCFATAVSFAPPGGISRDLCRRCGCAAARGDPLVARGPGSRSAVFPAALPTTPTDVRRTTFLEAAERGTAKRRAPPKDRTRLSSSRAPGALSLNLLLYLCVYVYVHHLYHVYVYLYLPHLLLRLPQCGSDRWRCGCWGLRHRRLWPS